MESFNFVFSLFGLLLGLALAEVLGGFGAALQERHKLRIGWLTPLFGLIVMCDLTSFWTWAWDARAVVSARYIVLLCALVITAIYYLTARLVFPHDRKEWPDFDLYYFTHKFWVVGGVLLSNALLSAGELALGFNPFATHLVQFFAILFYAQGIALLLLRSRRWSIAVMVFWLVQYPATGIYNMIAHGSSLT